MMVSATAPGASCALTLAVKALVISDPVPYVWTEARSCEGDGVGARTKILDAVLAAAVRDDGADLFNQRGALRLDGDVRKRGARRVMHHAGNRLCECAAGNARSQCEENRERPTSMHEHLSIAESDRDMLRGLTRFQQTPVLALSHYRECAHDVEPA